MTIHQEFPRFNGGQQPFEVWVLAQETSDVVLNERAKNSSHS
jgi:hypothetical protein